jgi:DNA polymerase delta subunit 2
MRTDCRFLGTSGQNISDICRYANDVDPLLAASQTILCRHVAPTAPDTLPCYPFSSSDPFIIDQHSPNVYFIGNQDRFDSKLLTGKTNGNAVRIILVPSFARTNSAALVNLRTLECFPLTIQ